MKVNPVALFLTMTLAVATVLIIFATMASDGSVKVEHIKIEPQQVKLPRERFVVNKITLLNGCDYDVVEYYVAVDAFGREIILVTHRKDCKNH